MSQIFRLQAALNKAKRQTTRFSSCPGNAPTAHSTHRRILIECRYHSGSEYFSVPSASIFI
jgi:hypothetical protein